MNKKTGKHFLYGVGFINYQNRYTHIILKLLPII